MRLDDFWGILDDFAFLHCTGSLCPHCRKMVKTALNIWFTALFSMRFSYIIPTRVGTGDWILVRPFRFPDMLVSCLSRLLQLITAKEHFFFLYQDHFFQLFHIQKSLDSAFFVLCCFHRQPDVMSQRVVYVHLQDIPDRMSPRDAE
jgi:hypothetical protein